MPGILGIIGQTATTGRNGGIEKILGYMTRDSSSTSGNISLKDLDSDFGWVTAQGAFMRPLPIWNDRKDICLLFMGEHFGDEASHVALQSQCNHEVGASMVCLYEKLGLQSLSKLNGSFSGVLVDNRERKIIIFNDRYGLSRIYYHDGPDGFYFSSEAKALLKMLPSLRQLDVRSTGEFLSCGCVLQDRTLFNGISLLPAGSAWTFRRGQPVEKRRYFQPSEWEHHSQLSPGDYYECLTKTFPQVLKRYSRRLPQMGMSLTGGLDGRLVMAWSESEAGQLPCYTFGSCYRETADVRIARQVAHACHQPHQVISVGDEFIRSFPLLAEKTIYLTDGAMDVSGAAELYVNHLAADIASVRLTGNYGSEILRSSVAFRPRPISEHLFDGDLMQAVKCAATTYAEESRGNRRSFIAFKQVPWHHFARLALEKSQLSVRSPYLDNDLVALAFQAPQNRACNFNICLRLIAEGNPRLSQIPTDRAQIYRANKILNRLRRSKEQFLARAEYAYDYGMPHWLAQVDRLLSPLRLERLFLGRQKFCHFRTWYRGCLAPYVKEILLDSRSLGRPYLHRHEVERTVARHVQGTANFTTEIHKLLTLELTQRLLLEGM